jgi:hypothetical protein
MPRLFQTARDAAADLMAPYGYTTRSRANRHAAGGRGVGRRA